MKRAEIGIAGRDAIVKGANFLADGVKITLGHGGQNYLLEKGDKITNDGVTVGRELVESIKDELEERGARTLLKAVSKANEEAGDGSTTATVLAQSFLKACLPYLASKDRMVGKLSPMKLIKKVNEESQEIIQKLKDSATQIKDMEELIEVATVSVEDPELGKLIGTAQWELGPEGFILAEETNNKACTIERVNGLYLDNGFGTSAVVNNAEKEALEVKNVSVIYTNNTITIKDFGQEEGQSKPPLVEVIESLLRMGRKEIVIMARAFTQDAIQHCLNQAQSGLFIYPLNAPYTDQAEIMQDLQAIIGGRFINTDISTLDGIQVSDVGFATHVLAKRSTTVFAGEGKGVEERVKVLEDKRDGSGSDFEKNNLTSRIAQLTNGFALLKVGAQTETERKYIKDKVDDAVNAVRAALQEGVVKGGGLALKEIGESLPDDYILKNALKAPYEQILINSGDTEIPDWVKDSVKVTRIAVEKAASVAPILATAGGVVTTKKPSELDTLLKR